MPCAVATLEKMLINANLLHSCKICLIHTQHAKLQSESLDLFSDFAEPWLQCYQANFQAIKLMQKCEFGSTSIDLIIWDFPIATHEITHIAAGADPISFLIPSNLAVLKSRQKTDMIVISSGACFSRRKEWKGVCHIWQKCFFNWKFFCILFHWHIKSPHLKSIKVIRLVLTEDAYLR